MHAIAGLQMSKTAYIDSCHLFYTLKALTHQADCRLAPTGRAELMRVACSPVGVFKHSQCKSFTLAWCVMVFKTFSHCTDRRQHSLGFVGSVLPLSMLLSCRFCRLNMLNQCLSGLGMSEK